MSSAPELAAAAAPGSASLMFGPFGRLLLGAAKGLSLAGGLVFVLMVAMSLGSIVGRKLYAAPVPGDVELLQMAAAFASASFFAWCHLNGGDVKVDFFTAHASPAAVHRLDALGSLLVGLFGTLLTWRASVGALALWQVGETSMILGWPVWIAQMLMLPGLALLALAGFYKAGVHLRLGCTTAAKA